MAAVLNISKRNCYQLAEKEVAWTPALVPVHVAGAGLGTGVSSPIRDCSQGVPPDGILSAGTHHEQPEVPDQASGVILTRSRNLQEWSTLGRWQRTLKIPVKSYFSS